MKSMMTAYGMLAGAIACEVVATNFLMRSEQFTKIMPTVISALLYAGSFYFLAQALRTVPLGIAYGIWGGLGIVLTAVMGVVVFKQRIDVPAMIGLVLIVGGVVVVNVFSKTMSHG